MGKFKIFTEVKIVSLPKEWRGNNSLKDFLGKVTRVVDVVGDCCLVNSPANFVGLLWIKEDHLQEVIEDSKVEDESYNPLVAQEGGGHYKDKGVQPLEYTMKNNLSFCEGNVVKYISRYKSKNGIEDLAKVIHYALLASYEEYGEQGSTELKEKVLKLLGVTE